MKKAFKVISLLVIAIILLLPVSVLIVNDYSANQTSKSLCDLPLPKNTKFIESVSQAGKLVGNGNGMQYFGAILIKSDLSQEELENYYSQYREDEWDCLVEVQNKQEIDFLEHTSLKFKNEDWSSENYYIIYSWGSGISPFDELDLRGH